MNATQTILWQTAKRVVLFMILPVAYSVYLVTQPVTIDWTAPEHGAGAASEYDKALHKAMKKCKTLPEGELPGAVVIDFANVKGVADPLPIYSERHFDVDQGFQYAIQKFQGIKGTVQDKYIDGVTLCK